MCTREMTLGEEIISLTGKGVDIPTVERMYRKYIAIISDADTKKVTEELYHVDVNALFPTIEAIFAYYNNECSSGWLRNAMKKEFSSAGFVGVGNYGNAYYNGASNSYGVRPEFWLVR